MCACLREAALQWETLKANPSVQRDQCGEGGCLRLYVDLGTQYVGERVVSNSKSKEHSSRNIKNASDDVKDDMAALVGAGATHFRDGAFSAAAGLGDLFEQQASGSWLSGLTNPIMLAEQLNEKACGGAGAPDAAPEPGREPKFVDVGSVRNRSYGKLVASLRQGKDKMQEAITNASSTLQDANDPESGAPLAEDEIYVTELNKRIALAKALSADKCAVTKALLNTDCQAPHTSHLLCLWVSFGGAQPSVFLVRFSVEVS